MNDHSDIAVGFLAGGLARRMGGRNKALLEIGGRSILEWQLAATEQQIISAEILARLPAYWPVWIIWLNSMNRYQCCCPVPPMPPLFRQI